MSMPEDRSPLRDAYLARLVEFGVDLAFKDEKPKEFPNPFASGTFDPKAAKTAQRMLGAQRHYTDWRSVASEPYALFLARLSQVGKIPRSFIGAHLPAAQEVLQDEMNEVLGWLAIQSVKLPCDVFAGLYPTGELSAQISPVPGQGALLLVNVGLMDLIFSLLKINIATPAPGEKETLLTEKQATLAVVELFNAYLYGEGSLGAWPLPRLPEDRERPLGFVLRRCEQFVLCHEIGHLVLGHVAVDGPEVRHSIGAYTPSQESDADRFAVEVLNSRPPRRSASRAAQPLPCGCDHDFLRNRGNRRSVARGAWARQHRERKSSRYWRADECDRKSVERRTGAAEFAASCRGLLLVASDDRS